MDPCPLGGQALAVRLGRVGTGPVSEDGVEGIDLVGPWRRVRSGPVRWLAASLQLVGDHALERPVALQVEASAVPYQGTQGCRSGARPGGHEGRSLELGPPLVRRGEVQCAGRGSVVLSGPDLRGDLPELEADVPQPSRPGHQRQRQQCAVGRGRLGAPRGVRQLTLEGSDDARRRQVGQHPVDPRRRPDRRLRRGRAHDAPPGTGSPARSRLRDSRSPGANSQVNTPWG